MGAVFSLGEYMNRPVKLAAVVLMAANLGACATIVRGTSQQYVINTNPEGARVTLSTGQTCTSPCTLTLKRKHPFTVTAAMEGYETVQAQVRSQMRGSGGTALAGNLVFGGLIGGAVDAGSGALNSLTPNPLSINMVRIGSSVAADAAEAPAAAPADAAPQTAQAAPAPAPAQPN